MRLKTRAHDRPTGLERGAKHFPHQVRMAWAQWHHSQGHWKHSFGSWGLQVPPILRILILCEIRTPQTFSLFHSLASQVRRCREGIKPSLSWWNLPWIFLPLCPFIWESYLKDHCQDQHQRAFFLFFLLVVLQLLSYIEDFNLSVLFHSLVCGSPGSHDHFIKWPHHAHYGWRHSLCT